MVNTTLPTQELLKVMLVRCEAHSGNAQGERKLPRDSTFPSVLRLTQQARDNE